jgi:hypothetical protein
MHRVRLLSCLLAGLLLFPALAFCDGKDIEPPKKATYLLQTSVISAGGSPGSSTNYATNGTLGQPTPIGVGTSADKTLYAGFWGKFWLLVPVVDALIPEAFENMVFQNFPNPFNPSTTIEFTVAEETPVELLVYNVNGEMVKTLVDNVRGAGRYNIVWDGTDTHGRDVSSGVYFYRLSVGDFKSTKKMLMLK